VLHDISLDIADGRIRLHSRRVRLRKEHAVQRRVGPAQGRQRFDSAWDEDIVGKPGRVGYMLQKDLLLPWRTALDNIVLGASLTRGANAEDRAQAAELATHYGLGAYLNHYPWALSGGMRQRVALMRTVAAGREVMLLDEPFAALGQSHPIHHAALAASGLDGDEAHHLFVTHDIDEALVLADRVVVMLPNPGRIGRILNVNLERPREVACMASPAFMQLKAEALNCCMSITPMKHPSSRRLASGCWPCC
jgi:ABC-type nitrate/sulfonate/bicarbonate transport system ATPase subunit